VLPKRYHSTPNKDFIREEDAKLIAQDYKSKKRELAYLGMPSGEMRDILTWEKYFRRCTAVEIDEQIRSKLSLNIIRYGLEDKVRVMYGDIEEILIKGKDNHGNRLELPYDVIFLDFFGTILYKNLKRVDALKSLIQKQRGNDFLLLITFNLKEKNYSRDTLIRTFDKIRDDLENLYFFDSTMKLHIKRVIDAYKSEQTHEMYRQKLFVPYLIKGVSESVGFKVHAYPPIFYEGYHKNPMIHFRFKMLSQHIMPTPVVVSDQNIVNLINLNMKEVAGGKLFVRREQLSRLGNINS
jgi:hypothetical protein